MTINAGTGLIAADPQHLDEMRRELGVIVQFIGLAQIAQGFERRPDIGAHQLGLFFDELVGGRQHKAVDSKLSRRQT